MQPGNLQAASGRLQDALEQWLVAWEQTRDQWRDENSRHIEEEVLAAVVKEVKGAVPMIGQLALALQQARRDCQE